MNCFNIKTNESWEQRTKYIKLCEEVGGRRFLFLSPCGGLVALDLVVIVIKENISSACGQTETKWYSAIMLYY